eukprot:4084741-Pyramimonas_sp.AAC.1
MHVPALRREDDWGTASTWRPACARTWRYADTDDTPARGQQRIPHSCSPACTDTWTAIRSAKDPMEILERSRGQ